MKITLTKMIRDIQLYKGRTFLTLVGVLIGIAAIGAVLSAYAILTREMKRNYLETNPASIVLKVANLDNHAVKLVSQSDPNLKVEMRKTVLARVAKGNGTYGTIYLRAIADFQNQKVDTFSLEKGQFPINANQMVLERDCLKILQNVKTGVGEYIHIKFPGGKEKNIQLCGIVHAPGLSPASMENMSYAFLKLEGLKSLGDQGWYDEIRIISYSLQFNREQLQRMAREIKQRLIKNGYRVNQVDVPTPGKHPHADQLASLLFLLQAFTVIALLVACIIIINLLNFIMAKQSKQIAVMKAVGADAHQIAIPFFGYVMVISLGALVCSIPLSVAAGSGYSNFAAGILNFKIASYTVPGWVFGIQAAVGIILPLAAAVYPIVRSCRQSVINGLSESSGGQTGVVSINTNRQKMTLGINSTIMIPINNLIRKKSRTFLAILALAAGGALFMTSQNIVASIDKTVDASFKAFRWDYDIRLARVYPGSVLKEVLNRIKGLGQIEIWKGNMVLLKKPDGTDSAYYPVKVIPEQTKMINLEIAAGFRAKGEPNGIVVNKTLADDEKWLRSGMTTIVTLNGKTAKVIIAGIVNEVPALPSIYMKISTYEKLFGGNARQIILAGAKTRNPIEQREISKTIEERFKSAGIEISENWNIYVFRKAFVNHLYVIVTLLAIIAMLAVVVGGLSIASVIGINVSERKREIGVLRAVGANSHQIMGMVSLEVMLMGLAGWLIGMIISYPVSVWVGNYFGQIFLHTALQNTLSISGSIQWLILSIGISLGSGLLPAWNVATASLREMLAYE